MKFKSKNYPALTLVELLVVIGIIIILASVALVIIDPVRQQNRSRDAVLKNSIASLGQSVDTFYGLYGYYPNPNEATQVSLLRQYIKDSFSFDTTTSTTIAMSNGSVFANGSAGGTITYYINDFQNDGVFELPCIQAISNEDSGIFVAWAPGYAVTELVNACNTTDGYEELTGISL